MLSANGISHPLGGQSTYSMAERHKSIAYPRGQALQRKPPHGPVPNTHGAHQRRKDAGFSQIFPRLDNDASIAYLSFYPSRFMRISLREKRHRIFVQESMSKSFGENAIAWQARAGEYRKRAVEDGSGLWGLVGP